MKLTHALSILAVTGAGMVAPGPTSGQERQRPVTATPRQITPPARPAAPVRAVPSQTKVLVAPALDAESIHAIALQAAPPPGLTRAGNAGLRRVSERLRHKDRAAAEREWADVVESAARRDDKHKDWINLAPFSHYVLHQAYLEPVDDLRDRAEKVRFYNEQKRVANEQRVRLETAQRELNRSATSRRSVTVRSLTLADEYKPGQRAVTLGPEEPVTVESVVEDLQKIVVLCNTAEENEQQANLDLQNALQKQQQTFQMMSNVSKMMHDTAKAIIQNMKA
jgi:hypothetical protein